MTIDEVRVRPIRVPMSEPHRTASGFVSESPLILIDVTLEDGTSGHAILFTYTAAALDATAMMVQNASVSIVGESLAPALLTSQLHARFRLLGTQGLVGMAIAGLDMAMWDALANLHGVPLSRVLGSEPRPVQAYGAIGYDGVEGSAKTAEYWARVGVKGVKAKIGYPSVVEDVAVIKAIRAAAGPEMAILVDYNQSLSVAEAIARIAHLEEFGLTWIEEPVLATDYPGMAEVARESRTPIQAGESWWGPEELAHALKAGSSDYVMLDVMKIGGVTGWQRAAAMASGKRISSHLWPEVSFELLSATPGAHWLEYADWWNPVLENPLELKDGSAQPGASLQWNEKMIEECLV